MFGDRDMEIPFMGLFVIKKKRIEQQPKGDPRWRKPVFGN